LAQQARERRTPAAADDPFAQLQETVSSRIVAGLDAWRDMRDAAGEALFLAVYGNPWLQAAVGIDPAGVERDRRAGKNTLQRELVAQRIAQLKARMTAGGPREGLVRATLYVGAPRAALDERGIAALRRLRGVQHDAERLTLAQFKAMVREQFFLLLIDQDAAI